MTHTLKLGYYSPDYSTATYAYLSEFSRYLEEYVQVEPDVTAQESTATPFRSGGEIHSVSRRNVTESVRLQISGASASVAVTNLRGIQDMFFRAEEYQKTGIGNPVYLFAEMDTDSGDWRSEVLTGRVELDGSTWTSITSTYIPCVVTWTRRWYWEDATLREVTPLTNGNGSDTNVTVDNRGDSGNYNYVQIDGDDVDGVLPTPAMLWLSNNSGGTISTNKIYVAQNVRSTPASWDWILEGEDSSTGSTQVNASYSGGNYQQVTSIGTTHANRFQWTLDGTQLGYALGNYFRILAVFATSPATTTYVRFRVMFPASSPTTTLYETSEVQLKNDTTIQDLGVVQLPPSLGNLSAPTDLELVMQARDTGGSGTINLDFLQIVPLDGYREIKQLGYQLAISEAITDDGILNRTYSTTATPVERFPLFVTTGEPIHLWPGRDQRLYFLWDTSSGIDLTDTFLCKIWYRPRRLSL